MLYLLRYLKEFTFCTYFDALKVLIPTGLGKRTDVSYKLNDICDNIIPLSQREEKILELCKKKKGNILASAFEEKFADSGILLDSLTEKGYLVSEPIVIADFLFLRVLGFFYFVGYVAVEEAVVVQEVGANLCTG